MQTVTSFYPIARLLLPVFLLTACSGIRPYPDTLDDNLHLRTRTESGSLFSSVRAAVDIYRVNARCQTEYQGTVALDSPSVAIGIPVDQPSYLVFGFASSSWLANSSSSISYETLLTPRSGHEYDIEVTYLDDIYHVAILEKHQRNDISRDIGQRSLSDCIPG
jgi:hypothetical protein